MTSSAPLAAHGGFGRPGYRAYVLVILVLVYTFNFIDRVVISIVQEPIKHEFALTDGQLGLMAGPAFVLFYATLGIPIARLAERFNRTTILAVCTALWSAMTALCGAATSFPTLFLARIGVGVGEAGCTPPSQSLITDYFPHARRSTAIAIYTLGVPLGALLAAFGGGWIAQNLGWREAFLVLGLPGVALALLLKLTIKEPPRAGAAAATPGFVAALKILGSKPAFWHVAVGGGLASFVGYGVGQFTTSFLIRIHGLSLFEASQGTGVLIGVFGGVGIFSAGFVADRIARTHPGALAWLPAIGFLVATPLQMLGYRVGSLPLAFGLLAAGMLAQYLYLGAMYAVAQGVSPPRIRATAAAILILIVNLIGYGFGPPIIGLLSDFLSSRAMAEVGLTAQMCLAPQPAQAAACVAGSAAGLQTAMQIGCLIFLWAGFHFFMAWRSLSRDWHAEA
jgi:MFS family permease